MASSNKKNTKADVIAGIAEKNPDISKQAITKIMDDFLLYAKQTLVDGTGIELRGFGSFELRLRKEKANARNPRTGKTIHVPAHNVVAFRPGKDLKEAVWKVKD